MSPRSIGAASSWSQAPGRRHAEVLTSDGHEGIQAALRKYLPEARGSAAGYFMRNALTKVGAKECLRRDGTLRLRFARARRVPPGGRGDRREVGGAQAQVRAADTEQVESCLTVHELPSNAKRRLHSTNMMERVMREIKRRTNVVGIFPNTAAADRLIGAQLLERQETWQCEGKRYIVMDEMEM